MQQESKADVTRTVSAAPAVGERRSSASRAARHAGILMRHRGGASAFGLGVGMGDSESGTGAGPIVPAPPPGLMPALPVSDEGFPDRL
jgi:hypothetical protein